MQWSKLKSRIKSLIAPEVRGRIDFHLTSYRGSHDGADKVWITVDGKRIFSCKHYPREWAETAAYQSGLSRDEIKPTLAKVEIPRLWRRDSLVSRHADSGRLEITGSNRAGFRDRRPSRR